MTQGEAYAIAYKASPSQRAAIVTLTGRLSDLNDLLIRYMAQSRSAVDLGLDDRLIARQLVRDEITSTAAALKKLIAAIA